MTRQERTAKQARSAVPSGSVIPEPGLTRAAGKYVTPQGPQAFCLCSKSHRLRGGRTETLREDNVVDNITTLPQLSQLATVPAPSISRVSSGLRPPLCSLYTS